MASAAVSAAPSCAPPPPPPPGSLLRAHEGGAEEGLAPTDGHAGHQPVAVVRVAVGVGAAAEAAGAIAEVGAVQLLGQRPVGHLTGDGNSGELTWG